MRPLKVAQNQFPATGYQALSNVSATASNVNFMKLMFASDGMLHPGPVMAHDPIKGHPLPAGETPVVPINRRKDSRAGNVGLIPKEKFFPSQRRCIATIDCGVAFFTSVGPLQPCH